MLLLLVVAKDVIRAIDMFVLVFDIKNDKPILSLMTKEGQEDIAKLENEGNVN